MLGYEKLKGLLIAEVGTKMYDNKKYYAIDRSFIICKFKKTNWSDNDYVYDIFNNSMYYTSLENKSHNYCIRYFPLIDAIDDYKIIKTGYISRKLLFELSHELNKGQDLIFNKLQSKDNKKDFKNKETKKDNKKYKELTSKEFECEPTIGRKKEINNLITILASDKKSPILVGESGTGKTSIVDEFAYLIQKEEVPNFLKDKKIIEVSSSSLVSGTRYVGTLEKKFEKLLRYIKEEDAILFIDEIHTIFGAGASSKDDNDLAELLKEAINRENIKVIGTTTSEEYNKYFTTDALKRRFELIKIEEPTEELLKIIARKVFEDYSNQNEISIDNIENDLNNIVDLLIDLTKKEHRNFNDVTYNPDLIVTLIDKSFASAKINDRNNLNINDIIYAVESTDRIYDPPKEKCISNLKGLKPKEKKLTNNIIKFNK